MKLSLYVGETRDLVRSPAAIADAERRALHGVWLAGGLALDTLTVLPLAAGRTKRAQALVHDKYAGSFGGDLSRWRRTALPVAVDLGQNTTEGGKR